MENKEIFRKKAVDRVASPEQLNDYIHVTSPAIWMALIGIILILAGALVLPVKAMAAASSSFRLSGR